jgi:DnaJ-class molecular chaperone
METIEICNIWKCHCNVKVKDDEQLCPECKGQGASFLNASFKQRNFSVVWCSLCLGEGKVDWITAINKQRPNSTKGYPIIVPKTKEIKMRCTGPLHCKKQLKRFWSEKKKFSDPWYPMT